MYALSLVTMIFQEKWEKCEWVSCIWIASHIKRTISLFFLAQTPPGCSFVEKAFDFYEGNAIKSAKLTFPAFTFLVIIVNPAWPVTYYDVLVRHSQQLTAAQVLSWYQKKYIANRILLPILMHDACAVYTELKQQRFHHNYRSRSPSRISLLFSCSGAKVLCRPSFMNSVVF